MATKEKASTKKTATTSKPRKSPRPVPPKYTHVTRVEVFLWGKRIGVTVLDPRYAFYVFRYTPEFRKLGIEPAPLQMPTGGWPIAVSQRRTSHRSTVSPT
jgi:hypothetical protein